MKNYTPSLVNGEKVPMTLKRFFLGGNRSKNLYYQARHKEEKIRLLWIETERFGKMLSFPCVLDEDGDPMVYRQGGGMEIRRGNAQMLRRWNLMVPVETFSQDYAVEEMAVEDFRRLYDEYTFGMTDDDEEEEEAEDGEAEAQE